MKTSEDKLNEALRDVLKRKFDDYEEQPNANALERIRARVKPARTGKYWWFTGALVLLSVSGILLSRFVGGNKTSFAVSEKAVAHTASEAVPAASGDSKLTGETPSVAKAPVHSAQSLSRKTIWKIPVSRPEKLVKSVFVKDPGNQPASKVHNRRAGNTPGATVNRDENLPPVNTDITVATMQGADPVSENGNALLAEEAPAQVDSTMTAMPLEELASMALKEMQVPLHLRGVVAPAFKPAKGDCHQPDEGSVAFQCVGVAFVPDIDGAIVGSAGFSEFQLPDIVHGAVDGLQNKRWCGAERYSVAAPLQRFPADLFLRNREQ